jgi:polysaccharide biosynthesis/export protein VpsN
MIQSCIDSIPTLNQTNHMNMKSVVMIFAMAFGVLGSSSAQSVISAGRAIQIEIRGVPPEEQSRVNGLYTVSEGGTINMPFINTVRAAGLTPTALGSSIAAAYKSAQIYKEPNVQVQSSSAEQIEKQLVHVGGQVRRTGPVEFVQGLTIYQAVQGAGGASEFGAINRVQLLRGGSVKTLDLTVTQFMNFPLQPNDTLTVPEKNWIGR